MSMNVLIAAPVHEVLINGLKEQGYNLIIREKITQEEAYELVCNCTGIITSTRLLIDKKLIDTAPGLKWVGRMGSGMEIIDREYASAKGISCFSSPEGNRNAVAEHALGMLLNLNKRIVKSNNEILQGKWLRNENRGVELEGKTVGIIGFGNTGGCFAKKMLGFDVEILAYDINPQVVLPDYVKRCPDLDIIFEKSDIISFHVPLQEDTYHLMNNDFVDRMKKPFILINTSRGKVVETKALFEGLASGKISGACLDVWEEEPISKMSKPMLNYMQKIAVLPQVIVTPHIAGYSTEALYKMSKVLLDRIVM